MSKKILIIDDDSTLNNQLQQSLQHEGYQVACAADGKTGMRMFYQQRPDLVVVEAYVPKLDGYSVCQHIRDLDDTPIIMVSFCNWLEDIILGLEKGADDYVVKPFRVGEFLARVRAALRRPAGQHQHRLHPDGYDDGYLSVDLKAQRVMVDRQTVRLTQKEYELLKLLVQNKDRLLPPAEILVKLWGPDKVDRVEFVRVYIQHLRQKLETDPKNPMYLINRPNRGYRFLAQV